MQHALTDFRIENERVVLLAFADGSKYRVSPDDLGKFLANGDLMKVQEALALRRQFMKRILPPTVMIVLVGGILGLGTYDAHRVVALMSPQQATCIDVSELQAAYQAIGLGSLGTSMSGTAAPPQSSSAVRPQNPPRPTQSVSNNAPLSVGAPSGTAGHVPPVTIPSVAQRSTRPVTPTKEIAVPVAHQVTGVAESVPVVHHVADQVRLLP